MNKFVNKILPHPVYSLVIIIGVFFFFHNGFPVMFDPDVPWHLEAGKDIIALGELPQSAEDSYTAEGYKWYNMAWLWGIIIASINAKYGLEYVFIFQTFMGLLVTLTATYFVWQRTRVNEQVIQVIAVAVALSLIDYLYARPQLLSYVLVVISHFILHQFIQGKYQRLTYILIPLIMVIWVNTHGAFIVAFSIIGAYFLGAIKQEDNVLAKKLFILGVVTGLACLCNPYGIFIFEAIFRTIGNIMTPHISEWRPFRYNALLGTSLFLLLFVVSSNSADERIFIGEKLLVFVWFLAAMDSTRNFIIFVLIASPYMALQLQKIVPNSDFTLNKVKIRITLFVLAMLCIYGLTQSRWQNFFSSYEAMVYLEIDAMAPVETIEFAEENYPNTRFFNDYGVGGYLTYYSDIKVFIDGRAGTAYPNNVLQDYLDISLLQEGWERLLNKYEVEGAILLQGRPLYQELIGRDDWEEAYKGKRASVMIRLPVADNDKDAIPLMRLEDCLCDKGFTKEQDNAEPDISVTD